MIYHILQYLNDEIKIDFYITYKSCFRLNFSQKIACISFAKYLFILQPCVNINVNIISHICKVERIVILLE